MFATGPRAVGFTIVWPEGVIFRSMMTYHVQFLLLVVAGWVNRQQQDVIDYLQEENRVLRAGLRGKRLRLSDDDRRRLVVKAQALGREALAQIASVATSATLLRWYRRRTCISSKASEWLARVVLGLSITAFAVVVFYIESRRFLIRDSPRPATTYEQKTGGADGVKGA